MNVNPFAPAVIPTNQLTAQDRAAILRAIGQRWTEFLLNLESGDEWLQHDYSLTVIANIAAPYAHPLLTPGNTLDLMVGLHGALRSKQRYEYEGVLPDKDEDYLGAMLPDERIHALEVEVRRCVFALLNALEPCRACTVEWDDMFAWSPQRPDSALCQEHAAQSLRSVR